MALYLIRQEAGAATLLVRAGNGHRALELLGLDEGDVTRVTEDGPEGAIGPDGTVQVDDETDDGPATEAREVDVTTLADRGVRRYRDLDTGTERTEADPDD